MNISRREVLKRIGALPGLLWLSACSVPTRQLPIPPPAGAAQPKRQKTIALLGSTGMAGGYILREALVQGYDIRALARNPAKLDYTADQITIVRGDARDSAAIQELLRGSDVVISAIGPVPADGHAARNICSTATGHIIQAMQALNIPRYILLSGAAVIMPGDARNLLGRVIRILAQIALSDALHDKQEEYQLLEASAVQWTLVRCPLIVAEQSQKPARASLDTPVAFTVRAGELARFVLEQTETREYIRKGPFLGSL